MQPLGYSTGAPALSDFRKALEMLKDQPVNAIELSAIREHELVPLLRSIDYLNLFEIQVHFHSCPRPVFSASGELDLPRTL